MPALLEPVPPATARLLRRAVLDLAAQERRRHFPAVLQDVDADWLGPLLRSAEEGGVDLVYVVVTRHGWVDPRTDVRREWRRIRDRRR